MTYCANCGTALADDVVFCPNCGTKAENKEIIANEVVAPVNEANLPQIKSETVQNIGIPLRQFQRVITENNFAVTVEMKLVPELLPVQVVCRPRRHLISVPLVAAIATRMPYSVLNVGFNWKVKILPVPSLLRIWILQNPFAETAAKK